MTRYMILKNYAEKKFLVRRGFEDESRKEFSVTSVANVGTQFGLVLYDLAPRGCGIKSKAWKQRT